jgi:hypothetical protein
MMRTWIAGGLLAIGATAWAVAGGQDKTALKTALKDTEVAAGWIYDDLPAGYAEAKKTGKPMLIVFR